MRAWAQLDSLPSSLVKQQPGGFINAEADLVSAALCILAGKGGEKVWEGIDWTGCFPTWLLRALVGEKGNWVPPSILPQGGWWAQRAVLSPFPWQCPLGQGAVAKAREALRVFPGLSSHGAAERRWWLCARNRWQRAQAMSSALRVAGSQGQELLLQQHRVAEGSAACGRGPVRVQWSSLGWHENSESPMAREQTHHKCDKSFMHWQHLAVVGDKQQWQGWGPEWSQGVLTAHGLL